MSNVNSIYSSLSYLPIIIFFIILFLAFWIGFMNTTKPALYFLIFNIIFISLYYFVGNYFDTFLKSTLEKANFKMTNFKSFHPILFLIYLFAYNSLVFNFYFLFRKSLKNKINDKKYLEESILLSRIIGGIIWIIVALPFAITITEISTIFFGTSSFTEDFNKHLLYYLTFKDLSLVSTKELQEYINHFKSLKFNI